MDLYPIKQRYRRSRISSAWRVLLEAGIDTFPVSTKKVAAHLKIPVLRYSQGEHALKELGLYDAAMYSDAIAIPLGVGKVVIMYDDSIKPPRARVAVGHELGHIMLGHVTVGVATAEDHPPRPEEDYLPLEYEANLWGEQLIAPTGVLLAAGITTRDAIEEVCQVNRRASDFIMDRLSERPGYVPTHPDEIEVVRRFMRSL